MAIKGSVFHIIHGSFVDGYGIRTTVFLKGCPLKCIWCCNPEGQAFQQELKVIAADCNGCGNCVSACPQGAILMENQPGGILLTVDRKLCNHCGRCIDVCYTNALSFFGKEYTVEELFNIIQKDAIFYRSSDGGVTIGGGEATWQPEFTLALIRKCKENYIHTAIDTCGYVTSTEGRQALAEADLILFDLKGMDSQDHLKNTGVPNEIILENLKNLNALGKEIIIRVPVIPGYTDSQQNLTATAAFLATLPAVVRVDILPVHQFGKVKYAQIGMEYKLGDVQLISPERQEQIKALFASYGLTAQIGG